MRSLSSRHYFCSDVFFLPTPHQCPIRRHQHHNVVRFLQAMDGNRNLLQCSTQCISCTNFFVTEVLIDCISIHILGPIASFLINNAAKTPFFFNSAIPFNTQKPLFNTSTFPPPQIGRVSCRSVPTVLPMVSNSLSPSSCGRSFFPS